MENEGHMNYNCNGDDHDGFPINEIPDLPWSDHLEYDVDALLGAEDHMNTNQTTDGEDHGRPVAVGETPPKRTKRFTMHQIQELETQFRVCTHPNPDVRQEIGAKIGLEERQVKFWFQNRRSQKKLKAFGDENKDIRQELAKLKAEHEELKKRTLNPICFRCLNSTAATQQAMPEKWSLLNENARLNDEYLRAKAYMDRLGPGHMNMDPAMALINNSRTTPPTTTNVQATLISHAERAMKEFVMLATKGEPMWVPAMGGGETLNHQEYILRTFPGLLGLCPHGFVEEATRETDMIKGTAMDFVSVLTDVKQWSEMFPGIVAYVSSSKVISSGSSSLRDGLIQLMNVELWTQSPRLLNRRVKFLRFSKMVANGRWAVADVSVEGICGGLELQGSGSGASYRTTGCRLLPSGCLLEDMSRGYCKVTWIVHAEYDESAVPFLFRPFVQSGHALGASRWLRSLQRQCEFMTVLRSSNVLPSSSSSSSAISTLGVGRRDVLVVARRMMESFYAAVSGPVALPAASTVDAWHVSGGSGAESVEAVVRLAKWNCADVASGEPDVTVLSAATTVWLPGTPPPRVFEYLCDLQRRGEWHAHANGGPVLELGSAATSSAHLHGNAVSVLQPTIVAADEAVDSKMLILQATSTDVSCSLVVYSLIEESLMRGIMDGRDRSTVFLLPSGFAILPDGHGKATHPGRTDANSSSSAAAIGGDHTGNAAGSFVTVAVQALVPAGDLSGNLGTGAFAEDARQQLCNAIAKIKAAVGATNIIPA